MQSRNDDESSRMIFIPFTVDFLRGMMRFMRMIMKGRCGCLCLSYNSFITYVMLVSQKTTIFNAKVYSIVISSPKQQVKVYTDEVESLEYLPFCRPIILLQPLSHPQLHSGPRPLPTSPVDM